MRKEPGTNVEVINGAPGELTVSVNGREIARKGATMPDAGQVLEAVRKAAPAQK